jgi:hypothetical protein
MLIGSRCYILDYVLVYLRELLALGKKVTVVAGEPLALFLIRI